MAFQELATNAVKYGALSNDVGEVRVEWESVETKGSRALRVTWQETGGPPVQAPTHRGFGTRLIERGLASDLGGEARIEFARDGLICTLDIAVEETP